MIKPVALPSPRTSAADKLLTSPRAVPDSPFVLPSPNTMAPLPGSSEKEGLGEIDLTEVQEQLNWPPPPSPDGDSDEIHSGVIEMPSGGPHSIMGWLEGLPEHLARLSTAEAAAGQRPDVKTEPDGAAAAPAAAAAAAAAAAIKTKEPAAAASGKEEAAAVAAAAAAAAAPPAAAAVPAAVAAAAAAVGWSAAMDPASGAPFYIDPQNTSHWELPKPEEPKVATKKAAAEPKAAAKKAAAGPKAAAKKAAAKKGKKKAGKKGA